MDMTEYKMMQMVEPRINAVARPQTCVRRADSAEATTAAGPVKKADEAPKEKYAPRSDAPYRSIARLLIGGVHFAVLAGIVALLVCYGVAAMRSSKRMAVATVVDPQTEGIVSRVDGVFKATVPISPGGAVKKGQVLGTLDSPETDDQIEAAKGRWRDLQRAILLATHSPRASSSDAREQEIRQLRLDANKVQSEMAQLEELKRELVVRSPIDGTILFGLSGSKEVKRNEELTTICPTGSGLRIEVKAPLKYVNEIAAEGVVHCRISTPEGEVHVTAAPVRESLQMELTENKENLADKQQMGSIVCIPDANSSQKLRPGWIGTLE
jgi:hypothetical protein